MIVTITFQIDIALPKHPYWLECDCQNTQTASPLIFLWLWKQHRLQTDRALTRHSEIITTSIFLECQIGFSTLAKERSHQTTLLPVAGLSRHSSRDHFEQEHWLPAFQSGFPCGGCLSNSNTTDKIYLNFLL